MCYSNMLPSVSQPLVSREPSTTTPTFDTELLPTHLQLCLGLGYLPAPGTMASPSIFFSYPCLNMGGTHSQAKTLWARFSKFRQMYICCHALLNRSSKVNIMLNEDATVKGKD